MASSLEHLREYLAVRHAWCVCVYVVAWLDAVIGSQMLVEDWPEANRHHRDVEKVHQIDAFLFKRQESAGDKEEEGEDGEEQENQKPKTQFLAKQKT